MIAYFIFLELVVALTFGLIPYYSRKNIAFGVSVPAEEYSRHPLKKMRRDFVLLVAMISSLKIMLFLFTERSDFEIWISLGLMVQCVFYLILYAYFHHRVKEMKRLHEWLVDKKPMTVIDTKFRDRKIRVSKYWFFVSFFIIIGTIVYAYSMYDRFPERIPMNVDVNFEVTNFVDKSIKAVLFIPMIQFFMTVTMGFVFHIIQKAKQNVDATNVEESLAFGRLFRYQWSLYTVASSILINLAMAISFYPFILGLISARASVYIVLISSAIIVIWALYLSFRMGQGGSKLMDESKKDDHVTNRDEDEFWKLGMFYYNPDDPSVFVEKRQGVGWTSNFARIESWLFLFGLIGLMYLMILIIDS
jgi:uncharacterized membrane protein